MKHPNNTDAYTAGRLDGYLPFGDGELSGFDDVWWIIFLFLFMTSI